MPWIPMVHSMAGYSCFPAEELHLEELPSLSPHSRGSKDLPSWKNTPGTKLGNGTKVRHVQSNLSGQGPTKTHPP